MNEHSDRDASENPDDEASKRLWAAIQRLEVPEDPRDAQIVALLETIKLLEERVGHLTDTTKGLVEIHQRHAAWAREEPGID